MGFTNYEYSDTKAVTVSLSDLKQSAVPFDTLEEAFGPSSLGILIVSNLPAKYGELRHKLLSYASYLANLSSKELDALSCPSAKYLTGWSHGKEALKSGTFDTLKGSFYVNCAFYQGQDLANTPHPLSNDFREFTTPNVWPDESALPGFRETFEELCTLIIDTAVLVARACDSYAVAHIDDYQRGYLERIVKTSVITKARLLHYFPPEPTPSGNGHASDMTAIGDVPNPEDSNHDSWCATHVDHGCLTGLCSALYIDEAAHPPRCSDNREHSKTLPPLPYLAGPPSPDTGLFIHARDSTITKVSIPADCLAFQTGEALQVITGGKFRAVPHFVRAGVGGGEKSMRVARNTLAVFTQPDLEEVMDRKTVMNFGQFSREVVNRFG